MILETVNLNNAGVGLLVSGNTQGAVTFFKEALSNMHKLCDSQDARGLLLPADGVGCRAIHLVDLQEGPLLSLDGFYEYNKAMRLSETHSAGILVTNAVLVFNLAQALQQQNRVQKAAFLYGKVIQILKDVPGSAEFVCVALNNQAFLFWTQRAFTEAQDTLKILSQVISEYVANPRNEEDDEADVGVGRLFSQTELEEMTLNILTSNATSASAA